MLELQLPRTRRREARMLELAHAAANRGDLSVVETLHGLGCPLEAALPGAEDACTAVDDAKDVRGARIGARE